MRVALVTCAALPEGPEDETELVPALARTGAEAAWIRWDDADADWAAWDAVLVRSPWDYVERRDAFLAWAEAVPPGRVHNPPDVLAWSTDKAYLAELPATVATRVLRPGDALPALDGGEWVVKPTVSAGGLDTGRWAGRDAASHAAALLAAGRTVIVQPYLAEIEAEGETALVYVDGVFSHARAKRPFLALGEEAPRAEGPGGLTAAAAMWDPAFMSAAEASGRQRAVADGIVAGLARRFGRPPLYARVDLVPADDGTPRVLEVELAEPSLWLDAVPGAADRLARALVDRARGTS